MADRAHDGGDVKPESVLIPLAALPKVLGLTASELRLFLLLAALSPRGGGSFSLQVDRLRSEYRSAIGSRISERKLDAALGVLVYAGAIEADRTSGGVLAIRVRAGFRVSLSDGILEEITNGEREGGNRGEGEGAQGALFSELRDVPDDERRRVREVTEKCLHAWANRTGRNPNRAKVTPSRLRMVGARLAEGWTPDDLFRSVAGLCYSEWHRENGHDKIELALRSAERVEKCHDLWLRFAPPDKVAAFEAATGEVVAHRADEIEKQEREERERAEYAAQLAEVERVRKEQEQRAAEEKAEDQEWNSLFSEQGTEGE